MAGAHTGGKTHLAAAEASAAVLSRGEGSGVEALGARAACCCRMWKMTVEDGRASGSGERHSLISAPISSGHSSGALRAAASASQMRVVLDWSLGCWLQPVRCWPFRQSSGVPLPWYLALLLYSHSTYCMWVKPAVRSQQISLLMAHGCRP